jgi:nitroreductase
MGTTGYAENIPALVVVLGDLSCYPEERDRHVAYIDASLAAMQFMLALETLGLASCPINWPDIEYRERLMDRELELPPHLRPVMLLAVGYAEPSGGVPFSAKKAGAALLRERNDYRP